MYKVVGKCGSCGGRVTIPTIWHGVNPPTAQCESCHAYADDTAHLPVMPMRPKAQSSLQLTRRQSLTDDGVGLFCGDSNWPLGR